jgi:hypothetical protein
VCVGSGRFREGVLEQRDGIEVSKLFQSFVLRGGVTGIAWKVTVCGGRKVR